MKEEEGKKRRKKRAEETQASMLAQKKAGVQSDGENKESERELPREKSGSNVYVTHKYEKKGKI